MEEEHSNIIGSFANLLCTSFIKFGANCTEYLGQHRNDMILPSRYILQQEVIKRLENIPGSSNDEMKKKNASQIKKITEYNRLLKNLGKKKRRKRRFKDDDKPKRPKNAFIFFLQDEKPRIIRKYPQLKTTKIVCVAAEKYRHMTDEEKHPYMIKAQRQKAIYDRKHEEYLRGRTGLSLKHTAKL